MFIWVFCVSLSHARETQPISVRTNLSMRYRSPVVTVQRNLTQNQFKATEVRELLEGNEEKFKGGAGGYVDTSAADKAANASALAAALGTPGFGTPKAKPKPAAAYMPTISNSSHLDAVPQPTPINR